MTVSVSFEVFPPKTADGLADLAKTVAHLDGARPAMISITYGAGGSDRQRSFDAIRVVREATSATIAAHLTCVGQSRRDVVAVIDRYVDLGVDHIVALRGDPPTGIDARYTPHPEGFHSTAELVSEIKHRADVAVSVSAYPERHPQSPTDAHDMDVLAAKVSAGADQAMTQMFFQNTHFYDYLERVAARGIDVPVVPGVFPIHSFESVARFAARCGATMPDDVARRFAHVNDSAAFDLAVEIASEQISDLVQHGTDRVHLYTLNRHELALAVCDRLALVPA